MYGVHEPWLTQKLYAENVIPYLLVSCESFQTKETYGHLFNIYYVVIQCNCCLRKYINMIHYVHDTSGSLYTSESPFNFVTNSLY